MAKPQEKMKLREEFTRHSLKDNGNGTWSVIRQRCQVVDETLHFGPTSKDAATLECEERFMAETDERREREEW